jgi:hypothetical protein
MTDSGPLHLKRRPKIEAREENHLRTRADLASKRRISPKNSGEFVKITGMILSRWRREMDLKSITVNSIHEDVVD